MRRLCGAGFDFLDKHWRHHDDVGGGGGGSDDDDLASPDAPTEKTRMLRRKGEDESTKFAKCCALLNTELRKWLTSLRDPVLYTFKQGRNGMQIDDIMQVMKERDEAATGASFRSERTADGMPIAQSPSFGASSLPSSSASASRASFAYRASAASGFTSRASIASPPMRSGSSALPAISMQSKMADYVPPSLKETIRNKWLERWAFLHGAPPKGTGATMLREEGSTLSDVSLSEGATSEVGVPFALPTTTRATSMRSSTGSSVADGGGEESTNAEDVFGLASAWIALLQATATKIEQGTPLFRLAVEAFFSQSHSLVWLTFLLNHMLNGDLLSLVFPLTMFGYALLEETPNRRFFTILSWYTLVVLWLKMLYQLPIFCSSPAFTPIGTELRDGRSVAVCHGAAELRPRRTSSRRSHAPRPLDRYPCTTARRPSHAIRLMRRAPRHFVLLALLFHREMLLARGDGGDGEPRPHHVRDSGRVPPPLLR